MQTTVPASQSTWQSKLAALGPGLLMASAAIGGSHLVSSTQAGAMFGWQLVGLILLVNLLKYPFFRFGTQYTVETGHSLVEGYAQKGRGYLWVFFILCVVSSVIALAGVGLLSASILHFVLPGVSVPLLATLIIGSTFLILLAGHFKALDGLTKAIMLALTVTTVLAVLFAASRGAAAPADFVAPSPWTLATLPFLVALMGWMPAPIEISALTSMWVREKQKDKASSLNDSLFDFNTGYITSAVLAIFFVALGALLQFGTGVEIPTAGGAYVTQLMNMYGGAIGQWAVPLIAFIAFMCMYGTTITVVDGYARASGEALRLLQNKPSLTTGHLNAWILGIGLVGLFIIIAMQAQLAGMLRFAMIVAFITAPVFAWLNLTLVRDEPSLTPGLRWLSYAGLIFLAGFTVLFLLNLAGIVK
ncbi:NRAMP family divalent metal transporter [Deinococcus radiophilus]|uniref:Divalent metal cation transporter n=2 Tax=Deinococcus radiophilus TaxID=32062 RepID=A0A3S0L917_9DEIO|nr:NRAMP family divalent metal transporter [Deinococcus radiophilus]RTR29876.1 divalent metal cation transporter [Deinococcus radiophilus]UFA49772.1 divalent metal cation transporter [Deinococcus radiophilus]